MMIILKNIVIVFIGFLIGIVYMFFDSKEYYSKKFLSNRNFYWKLITDYKESREVSQSMVNNCYVAFYTLAECDTEEGCDYISTAINLRMLNRERESLREKYAAIDEEIKQLMESQRIIQTQP